MFLLNRGKIVGKRLLEVRTDQWCVIVTRQLMVQRRHSPFTTRKVGGAPTWDQRCKLGFQWGWALWVHGVAVCMVFQGLEHARVDRKPRNWAPSVPVGGVIQGLKYVSRGFGTSIITLDPPSKTDTKHSHPGVIWSKKNFFDFFTFFGRFWVPEWAFCGHFGFFFEFFLEKIYF